MITVLHVDDDQSDIELVQYKLGRINRDIRIEGEMSARAALQRIQTEKFDAVLCDFQMPGMNGLDFLKALRESGEDVPFIFLTGQGNERLAVEALQVGADDYFAKHEGFAHYERLVHSIRSHVKSRREAREQQRMEHAHNAVFMETHPKTDSEFLNSLLLKLVEILDVEFALICEVDEADSNIVHSLSFVSGGRIAENISYSLSGTPCENIVGRELCVYESDVQERFPDDETLAEMSAVSYIGLPLFHRDGAPLGHVAILDTKPMTHTSFMTALLRAVSVRVSAEIERMRILRDLAASEQRLRNVIESMISGFALHEIICDDGGKPIDYRFLKINNAFEHLTGLKAADTIGKRALEVIPDLDHFWIETYGRVALTGEPAHFSNYNKALDRHYEVRAYSPVRGLFAVIFNEITERVETMRALRNSERRFRSLFEFNVAGIFRSTLDGRLLECNKALLKLLDVESSDELEGIRLEDFYVDPSEQTDLVDDLKQLGSVRNRTVRMRTSGGRAVECLLNMQLIYDGYVLGTMIEVSGPSLVQS